MTLTNKGLRVYGNKTKYQVANSGGTVTTIASADTDASKIHGFLATRNNANDSMYIPVADSSGYERGVKICYAPVLNNGGYFESLYANTKVASTSTPGGTVRGSESKITVEGNMAASAEAHGVMGKVNVAGTGGQVDTSVGVESLSETESSGAITTAYGFRANAGTALNATTAIAYGVTDTTGSLWKYGLDMNGITMASSGKEIRGRNGETIDNYTDGAWDFGAANLTTTGILNCGKINDGDTDTLKLRGIISTRNAADNSMYIPVATTSGSERGMKVCYAPVVNDGGYFDALYANVKVASDSTTANIVRALEAKATIEGNMAASAEAHAVYAKINVSGASAEVSKAIGVDVLLEEESSGTITEGTGIRVQGGAGAIDFGLDVSGDYRQAPIKIPDKSGGAIGAANLATAFGVAEGTATNNGLMGFYKDTADSNAINAVFMWEGTYKYVKLTDAS